MAIPQYIIDAARDYRDAHGGSEALFDAFIAGHKATKSPKVKNVALTSEQEDAFKECWTAYREKGNKAKAMVEWQKLTMFDAGLILPHIRAYVSSRERIYQKDFERYLKEKLFLSAVFKGNDKIYDPALGVNTVFEQKPQEQTINWQC